MTCLINAPMTHPVFNAVRWHDTAWQHIAVMALFGDLDDSDPRGHAGVLFRVEPDRDAHDGSSGRVLIQASIPPSNPDRLRVTDLEPVIDRYRAGLPVRLLLRANTVRTINRTGVDGKTRRHRARVPDSQLDRWLKDRLSGAVDLHAPMSARPWNLRRGRAQLITTTFAAVGTVADPSRLETLVRDGVGRAKPYGCGMLSVLPA